MGDDLTLAGGEGLGRRSRERDGGERVVEKRLAISSNRKNILFREPGIALPTSPDNWQRSSQDHAFEQDPLGPVTFGDYLKCSHWKALLLELS